MSIAVGVHAQSGPSFHSLTVALTGAPAPGTAGERFDRFGLPAGTSGAPLRACIDDDGHVAFHAYLGDGVPSTPSPIEGYFEERPLGLALVAHTDDPAPGTNGTFVGFPFVLSPAEPSLEAGRATIVGAISGVPSLGGLWSERSGTLQRVLLMTDTLSGTPAGSSVFRFAHGVRGSSIYLDAQYALSNPVTSDTEGLWVDEGSGFETIVVKGMPAPGTAPGVVFDQGTSLAFFGPLDAWDANRTGQAIFDGYLAGPGIDVRNDEGIWIGSPDGLSLVVREGDPVPGQPAGVRFGSEDGHRAFGEAGAMLQPTVNDRGTILFGAVMRGPGFDFVKPAFRLRNGRLDVLARASSSLPGTPPGDPAAGFPAGFTYRSFAFGTVNNADDVVLVGAATNSNPLAFVPAIWRDRGNGLELVAGVGRPVPGVPEAKFVAVQFAGFSDLGLLYYLGQMRGGSVTTASDQALFVMDADGRQSIVVRKGDAFDVDGTGRDLRTIADIMPGQGVSQTGVEPSTLVFTDGSMAVVKLSPDLALTADARFLAAATGGTVALRLDAGVQRAARPYVVAGTASGIHPGFTLGGITVPLNPDGFTSLSLSGASSFVGFVGVLDSTGQGQAAFRLPGSLPATLAGTTLHFAYVVASPTDFASNAVPLTFTR